MAIGNSEQYVNMYAKICGDNIQHKVACMCGDGNRERTYAGAASLVWI